MHTFLQNYWTLPNLLYIHSLAHWTWKSTRLKIKMQVKHGTSIKMQVPMYSATCLSAGKCFRENHSLLLHNIHHPLLLTRQQEGTEGRHLQLKNLFSISKPPPIIRSNGKSAARMDPGKGGDSVLVGSLHSPGTFCSWCDHTATTKGSDNPTPSTRN